MTAEIRQLETPPGPGRMATPQLRTLVVCDIADSTALVERMGDQTAANLIRKHDRLARALVEQHRGREIDKTDGFLLMFDRPIQAAAFALDYQRALKHMSAADGVMVRARVGIHMGDVVIWENAPEDVTRGAKPIEVEGLVKPVAARLAQLAQPQQTLMSSAAAGIAHRAAAELGADAASRVRWKNHGKYNFKGLPDPLEVVEVGEESVAPLRAPRSGRTAKRVLPWWRRPTTLTAEAAMLAIGIGVGAWFLLQSPPTLAFAARDWVVVGNLHNLTGDKLFNQSVDSALRISLEQSQYVNVLPEQSVQQTLQRMELNPEKTDVTRAIGSQVALREGARALILPTVADVGGRVRVTAEVIDPNTQATVYSVSADGVGDGSVLPSLDSVSKQLRGKLGEALAMVSKQSMPLAQITTPSLNALRAYSWGEKYYSSNNASEALEFYRQAIKIDPDFALAYVGIAKMLASSGHVEEALPEINKALAIKGRLSSLEELYVHALQASLTSSSKQFKEWQLLTTIYPDYFPGYGGYAYFVWKDMNNFGLAIDVAQKALVSRNPRKSTDYFLLGILLLGEEKYSDSIKAYLKAEKDGIKSAFFAEPYAAERAFSKASVILTKVKSGGGNNDPYTKIPIIAMDLDRGEFDSGLKLIFAAKQQSLLANGHGGLAFDLMDASVNSLLDTRDKALAKVRDFIKARQRWMPEAYRSDSMMELLFGAYLSARLQDKALAQRILETWNHDSNVVNLPLLSNMAAVVKAEILRDSGAPEQAIKLLEPYLNGSELFVTHVELRDVYVSQGDYRDAIDQALWLSSHRGRAYTEFTAQWSFVPYNVMQSDIALMDAAELSLMQHHKADAGHYLQQFKVAWPNASQIPAFGKRIQTIQAQLE